MKHLNGLILSGGKSERMGTDKGLIAYYGIPQRQHLFTMLHEFCDDVFLSCKSATGIPEELNPLADQFALESPLNGILSAFQHDATRAWITVPVDMPLITRDVIAFLLAARDTAYDATSFYDSDGREPEPLVCVWEPRCAPMLEDYFSKGNISPKRFLMTHNVKIVKPPFPEVHLNINTPDEVDEFKRRKRNG